MASLGGRQAGLAESVAIRLPPATDVEAGELIDASGGVATQLDGFRGAAALDRAALRELILRFAVLLGRSSRWSRLTSTLSGARRTAASCSTCDCGSSAGAPPSASRRGDRTPIDDLPSGGTVSRPRGYVALARLWASPVSGASMNPARSLGPAMVGGDLHSTWIYLAGPLAGGLLAVALAWALRGPPSPAANQAHPRLIKPPRDPPTATGQMPARRPTWDPGKTCGFSTSARSWGRVIPKQDADARLSADRSR